MRTIEEITKDILAARAALSDLRVRGDDAEAIAEFEGKLSAVEAEAMAYHKENGDEGNGPMRTDRGGDG